MLKQEVQYLRKGKNITNISTQEITTYDSVNKAKRASFKLQGGVLGRGIVRRQDRSSADRTKSWVSARDSK